MHRDPIFHVAGGSAGYQAVAWLTDAETVHISRPVCGGKNGSPPRNPAMIALWDGQRVDGPCGTGDMVTQAQARGVKIHHHRPPRLCFQNKKRLKDPPQTAEGRISMSLTARIKAPGPKKILALDGGGIRGMITVEVLAGIEKILRDALKNKNLVLADYFDFIAGTSTGAIIATCLSIGMATAAIRTFYEQSGEAMFDKAFLLKRFRYKYEDDKLAGKLKEIVGADTTLGSDKLKTLLMMVMRNATTDSPWPLSNNPWAKYNQPERRNPPKCDCNLDIPLWQLVRASTAAPVYFPPEVVSVGEHKFIFVDGGITTYNNPAFQAFLMATVKPYNLCWPAGEAQMLVVSVGTGTSPDANIDLDPSEMNLIYNAGSPPLGPHVRRAQRAGFALPGFRPVPGGGQAG